MKKESYCLACRKYTKNNSLKNILLPIKSPVASAVF